jgi:hypothetical protein
MTDKTFTELLTSANEALGHAQGKRNLYMTTLPFPPESVNGDAATRPQPARHARKRRCILAEHR